MCKISILRFLFTIFLLLTSKLIFASRITGGEFNFVQVQKGNNPTYKIRLKLTIDVSGLSAGEDDQLRTQPREIILCRKFDNARLRIINLDFESAYNIIYTNEPCALNRQLVDRVYTYAIELPLDRTYFNHPDGYYLTYEKCCRNGLIGNIKDPDDGGMVVYAELPPLAMNGSPFDDSLPVFQQTTGEFICRNKPFVYSFSAKDADGDALKYAIVTPLKGHNLIGNHADLALPAPYDANDWANGYSASNAISGSPPLSMDENSGIIKVTADKTGLYVFTIECRAFRNNQLIGIVRKDVQVSVTNCNAPPVAIPAITYQNTTVTDIEICEGKSIILEASTIPDTKLQWRKDGALIPGENAIQLTVDKKGVYTVSATNINDCSNEAFSQAVEVAPPDTDFTILSDKDEGCQGETVLVNTDKPTLKVDWFFENVFLLTDSKVTIDKGGKYSAILRGENGCPDITKEKILNFKVCTDTPVLGNTVYIPTAFSPNADGINDEFMIYNIAQFPETEVTIYNRRGEKVFISAPGYPIKWDGKSGGTLVPVGLYFYTVDFHDNTTKPVTGQISVLY